MYLQMLSDSSLKANLEDNKTKVNVNPEKMTPRRENKFFNSDRQAS